MRLRQLARMNKLAHNKNLLKALARIDFPRIILVTVSKTSDVLGRFLPRDRFEALCAIICFDEIDELKSS